MKKISSIILTCSLVIAFGNVAFAHDTGELNKASKTKCIVFENSYDLAPVAVLNDCKVDGSFSFEIAPLAFAKDNSTDRASVLHFVPLVPDPVPDVAFIFMAIIPDPIPDVSGCLSYLKITNPYYNSPFIDRKWVWFNSIITNS